LFDRDPLSTYSSTALNFLLELPTSMPSTSCAFASNP
jgi:hypothetical protein